jgi:tripartite-type tricarboxylate transporter receptor subunit TctC
MQFLRRHLLRGIAGAGTLAVLSAIGTSTFDRPASAQTRTIRIVTPVPPGGTTDILARLLADQVGRRPGVSVVVENRPGAGTVIGSDAVARAAPDGNTLLINTTGLLISPTCRKRPSTREPASSRFASSSVRRRCSWSTPHRPTIR